MLASAFNLVGLVFILEVKTVSIFKKMVLPGRPYFILSPSESPMIEAPKVLITDVWFFLMFSSDGATKVNSSCHCELHVTVTVEYNCTTSDGIWSAFRIMALDIKFFKVSKVFLWA